MTQNPTFRNSILKSQQQWYWQMSLALSLLLTGCQSFVYQPLDTSHFSKTLPIALVSMECTDSPDANRSHMISLISAIIKDHPKVRLIGFGETNLGYYYKPFDLTGYQSTVAEPITGTTVTLMREIAKSSGVNLFFGFSESREGRIYNSAVIIDDRGEILAHRSKSNFVLFDTLGGFTPGSHTISTAHIDGVKVGFLVCNDVNDRSYRSQILADQEIQALLLPHASAGLRPSVVARSEQAYQGIWFLAAQRYGSEEGNSFYGSWIIDPNGFMVSSDESNPGYLYYEVPVAENGVSLHAQTHKEKEIP